MAGRYDEIARSGLGESVLAAVADLKQRLGDRFGERLEAFLLFGSHARGEAGSGSDVDLAILVRGLDPGEKNAALDLVAEVELDHLEPLSTLFMSTQAFDELKRRERRLALDIESEGIAL